MQINDLMCQNDSVIRVLEVKDQNVLVIDCVKQTMPVWILESGLDGYMLCKEEFLHEITGIILLDEENATQKQLAVMRRRFTMIADILPSVGETRERARRISKASEEYKVSKQTVRSCLCIYLIYQDARVLMPRKRDFSRELTIDEKNMRWGLNKFFYSAKRHSLKMASYAYGEFFERQPDRSAGV